MSDYLTRLAWRALGLIPSAQPRVLSRFADGADAQFELPPERWDDNRSVERIPILEDPEPPAPAAPVAPPAARRSAPAAPRQFEPSAPSAPSAPGGEENLANPDAAEPAVETTDAEPPAAEPAAEPGPAEWGEQIAERAASEVTLGSPAHDVLPNLSESFPVSFPEGFQEGLEVAPRPPARRPHPPAPSPIALPSPGRGGELVAGAVGADGAVQRWAEVPVDPEGSTVSAPPTVQRSLEGTAEPGRGGRG